MSNIIKLIKLQWLGDFRQKFALASIFLYLTTASFICYKVFGSIRKPVWNALYWIIFIFSAISSVFLTFGDQFRNQKELFHQLFHPLEVFFGKSIYNFLLLISLGCMLYFSLRIFASFPVVRNDLFFSGLVLSTIGIAFSLSFLSALSSAAQINSTLTAVLALPLLLPIILLSLKITAISLAIIVDTSVGTDFFLLVALDLFILGIAIILFPYLWRS